MDILEIPREKAEKIKKELEAYIEASVKKRHKELFGDGPDIFDLAWQDGLDKAPYRRW